MKILAAGNENVQQWISQYTCTGKGWDQRLNTPCGALLEINSRDVKKRTHTDYGGGSETYYGFVCPICGCFTEIDDSKLPLHVRTNAIRYISNTNNSEK